MTNGNNQHAIYPHFAIDQNKAPNRFYAVPILGFVIKMIMLIPVFIESIFLTIVFVLLWIINSFVILVTGMYWNTAYDYFLGLMRFQTKIAVFVYGISDRYPGFRLADDGICTVELAKPSHPNRLFALPILGVIARFVLLIPYFIFVRILGNGSWIAMIISWVPVLFNGRFPESTYEFEKDTIRVGLSASCYLAGLSDTYPSFAISMKHQTIKILLLIAGTILLVWNGWRFAFFPHSFRQPYRRYYQSNFTHMRSRNLNNPYLQNMPGY